MQFEQRIERLSQPNIEPANNCSSHMFDNAITIATEPHAYVEIEIHATLFSWSISAASGIDRGRGRPTTTNVVERGDQTSTIGRQPPCTRLARLNIKLTHKNSAGGKNFTVLTSR